MCPPNRIPRSHRLVVTIVLQLRFDFAAGWVLFSFSALVCAQETRKPLALELGPARIQPGGFLDYIALYRTAITPGGVSTRFGAIPLSETPDQWKNSLAHSRVNLYGSMPAGPGALAGYYELDFLNSADAAPYRTRQLWGEYGSAEWKILAGHAWSLLRPNRAGTASHERVMNTNVVDPAYHVGLVGLRKRQVRVTHARGPWQAVAALEFRDGADFVAKVTHDAGGAHLEAAGLAGHSRRFALSLAAVLPVAPRLNYVSQLFWSQNAGPDIVGSMPSAAHAHSTIHGLEARVTKNLQLFAYGGLAYATRAPGNRLVRQWTAGFHRTLFDHGVCGSSAISLQYSQTDRAVWGAGHGRMNYFMAAWRHFLPARR